MSWDIFFTNCKQLTISALTLEGLSMFASLVLAISRNPRGRLSDFPVRRFPARLRTEFSSSSSSSLSESTYEPDTTILITLFNHVMPRDAGLT